MNDFSPDDRELLETSELSANVEDIDTRSEEEDAFLAQQLAWLPSMRGLPSQPGDLPYPVLIPQTMPGIQQPFSRAWAPILRTHGICREDFLQFIDHLNVCKAASPPLQVVQLAGMVFGFTPIPFAPLVGMGTQVLAGAGMYAVARVRIARYLERVNQAFFAPRGLAVRIAKQRILPQITGQSEDQPLLAPVEALTKGRDISSLPSLRDRRLKALEAYIAPLEIVDSQPSLSRHSNMVDRLSAKMVARKSEKQQAKFSEDAAKEEESLEKEMRKLEKEIDKVNKEAAKELRKKPGEHAKIERERGKEMAKIDRDIQKAREKFAKKTGKSVAGEDKNAGKFLWIVVEKLAPQNVAANDHLQ